MSSSGRKLWRLSYTRRGNVGRPLGRVRLKQTTFVFNAERSLRVNVAPRGEKTPTSWLPLAGKSQRFDGRNGFQGTPRSAMISAFWGAE
jgi:hypothetical protein